MLKKILWGLLVILVIIQFFNPRKNISAAPMTLDIANIYTVPSDVHAILDKACNDCHSNNTRYPWYANIQPITWWLTDHINEGKAELNFNEFGAYSPRKQFHKLEEVQETVEKDEMPLNSYTIIHGDANLTAEEKDRLVWWSQAVREKMKAFYPADSLKRKR